MLRPQALTAIIGVVLATALLVGCGRQGGATSSAREEGGTQPSASASSSTLSTSPSADMDWQAVAPGVLLGRGPPAEMQLKENGYVAAIYFGTPVAVGETWTANFTAEGPAGRLLRVVLQRHCDADKGEGMTSETFTLAGAPASFQVTKKFEEAYSCVRVMFLSQDGQPLTVKVNDLALAKAG